MAEAKHTDSAATASGDSPPTRRRSKRKIAAVVVGSLAVLLLCGYVGLKIWLVTAVPEGAPVIGVAYDTAWHARARISTKNYEIAVARAGGRMLEIDYERHTPEEILDEIDALLLTGGGDVDPALYGGDSETAQLVDRGRDDFEAELLRGAIGRDMPVLGICRGIQILNVVQGGTLRNLRDDAELSQTHGIGTRSMAAHTVEIAEGSRLAGILGTGELKVNSFHGQAVDRVGRELVVAARAADGVVEALEMPSRSFVVTTQWHPEVPPPQEGVWEAFLKAAGEYQRRRQPSTGVR